MSKDEWADFYDNTEPKSQTEQDLDSLKHAAAKILMYMGIAFAHGGMLNGEKDYAKALDCYRQAAGMGDTDAMYCAAISYANGKGVSLNHGKAVTYYKKAAMRGHAQAAFNLGLCFEHGWGTDVDIPESFKWYRRAAELGNPEAKKRLGMT